MFLPRPSVKQHRIAHLIIVEISRLHSQPGPAGEQHDKKTESGMAKLGSNLGQISAENGIKPYCQTQNQAKRINEIVFRCFFRDQGVGGSNPLSPTNYPK